MFLKLFRDFARPHWFDIVSELKRSTGLSVSELAKKLKMSYMGVKQHCVQLEKKGYLDTWRRPKPFGRPEKAYRLTKKADPIFPTLGVGFTLDVLDAVRQTYGATAPEKLLFAYFQREAGRYQSQVKGSSVIGRVESMAKIRDKEGYFADCVFDPERGLCLYEHHSLLAPVAEVYPNVHRMEEAMMAKALRTPVTRSEEHHSGLTRVCWQVGTIGKSG